MDGVAPVAESYFNVFETTSEQTAWLERENAELRKKETRLNSSNIELARCLKERETLEATMRSRVDVVDLQKAQAESALEAKVHELA